MPNFTKLTVLSDRLLQEKERSGTPQEFFHLPIIILKGAAASTGAIRLDEISIF